MIIKPAGQRHNHLATAGRASIALNDATVRLRVGARSCPCLAKRIGGNQLSLTREMSARVRPTKASRKLVLVLTKGGPNWR